MTRSFYSSAITFTTLYAVIVLFKSILFLMLGVGTSYLESLPQWFIFEQLAWLMWSAILLKYYHFHKYIFAFRALIIFTIISLVHFVAFSKLVRTHELLDYYILVIMVSLAASIVYALSLIISETGKRRWLRSAGIVLLAQGLIMFWCIIIVLNSTSFMLSGGYSRIEQWLTLIATLAPVAFVFHFLEEKRNSTIETTPDQESWVNTVNFAVLVTVFAGLYFSMNLILDSQQTKKADANLLKIAEPFEAATYTNSRKQKLQYRLLKPINYDSSKKYPLVVCLHGSSGCGNDNLRQIVSSLPAALLSKPENRTKYPVFLLVPQCPIGFSWGGVNNSPSIDSLVFGAIEALQKEFPLDKNRYYVAGNSLGGYGSWHFISTRPDMFAAAIPISGAGNAALAQNIVDVPVWAFHGAKDRNVLISGSRDIIEAMKKAGANPRYTEYPNKAHNIWNEVSDTPGLLDWLLAQNLDERKQKSGS